MSRAGYGHAHGVNLANYRLLSDKKAAGQMGYRSTHDWTKEAQEQLGAGDAENKISSTLRISSTLMQEAAADQVVADITSVDSALRSKLKQTEQLKSALQQTVVETMNEIDQCLQLKASLERRMDKVGDKAAVNDSRLAVRNGRPTREKTMDNVEGVLLHQRGLMSSFGDRVMRAAANLDREVNQLDACRRNLEADLKDKLDAIDVDTKVLGVQTDGFAGEAATLRRRQAESSLKTPHAWVNSTDHNIREARKWIADSVRLRKAIRIAVQNARETEHVASRNLNLQMIHTITSTRGVKSELEKQLQRVREEQSRAEAQRNSLANALEAKRGPLAQAKGRFDARRARPDREMVQDEVEQALAREIAHLNALTSQLVVKLSAVDKTIATLDMTAITLEDNIKDKETTLCMDEHMVLLDGRINVNQPPPSSIGSMSTAGSAVNEVREATMRRIQDLEADLSTARRERELLQSNVAHYKANMGQTMSPNGPLSPDATGRF